MTARENAKLASLNNTDARLNKVDIRQESTSTEPKAYSYQGHDPETGNELIKTGGCCDCDDGVTATGDRLTNAGIKKGEVIMSRQTEGFTRIDKKPVLTTSLGCGGTGQPVNRAGALFGVNGGDPLELEPLADIDPTRLTPPKQGDQKPLSARCVGFAYVYEEYTGEIESDGTYTTRTVTIQNSPECKSTTEPQSPINPEDDGCVKPGQQQSLKRCQWFDVTEEQANSFTGCPTGMFSSGFQEFPDGYFRALCCSEDGENVTEGIGREWQGKNVVESGLASEGLNYCTGAFTGEIIIGGEVFFSESPFVNYTKEEDQITVFDADGVIGGYQLSDSDFAIANQSEALPSISYCPEKPRAKLSWNGGEIISDNPPISYSVSPQCARVDYKLVYGDPTQTIERSAFVSPEATGATISGAFEPSWIFGSCDGGTDVNLSILEITGVGTDPLVDILTNTVFPYVSSCHSVRSANLRSCFTATAKWQEYNTLSRYLVGATQRPVISREILDFVPGVPYLLTVTDASGVILESPSVSVFSGFVVTCYDYKIDPQYVCRSNTKIC